MSWFSSSKSAVATPPRPEELQDRRLAARKTIRRQIAQAALLGEQIAAIDDSLGEIDNEISAAADAHSAVCGPLQTELAKLESAALDQAVSGDEADTAAGSRRGEIRRRIEEENRKLERVSKERDGSKAPLIAKRNTLVMERAALPTADWLAREEFAEPTLWRRSFALNQKVQLLLSCDESVSDRLARALHNDQVVDRTAQAPKWQTLADMLTADICAAKAEAARLHIQMIAE